MTSRARLMAAILGFSLSGGAVVANAEIVSEKASVRELLANPAKFHNKRVLVRGYLWIDPEGKVLVLYPSREALEKRPHADAIWIEMLACKRMTCTDSEGRRSELHQSRLARYLGRYVELEGTVDKRSLGNGGKFSAGIFGITRATTDGWEPEMFSHQR